MRAWVGIISLLCNFYASAQQNSSTPWNADLGNGSFKNPVIHADYSDPDAIRVGDDYYMVSSSFNAIPGIPILHSKDLVNWSLIGHALKRQFPFDYYNKVQHGGGVWAPAIRYHNNEFYIYYPDPDFGIYLTKAKSIKGPWTDPVLVEAGKGLIDPCPLWDDDGKVYLVHAFAGSRAGIKSVIIVKELDKDGLKVIGEPVLVYDGHVNDPTIEGPKFYKRNKYYYIFAPAGGVSTGWQTILRSRNVYGPYERKVVLDQGSTTVNGPHQGAWVDTRSGEHWFLHFQDKDAYGRVVHLQPLKWINDWPVIGDDKDSDGKGEPVMVHKKPGVGRSYPFTTIGTSDEFDTNKTGLQWQWQANPNSAWAFHKNGKLRLYAQPFPDTIGNYWTLPSILTQKFPAEDFNVITRLEFKPVTEGERAGLIIMGIDYAFISVVKKADKNYISFGHAKNADKGNLPAVVDGEILNSPGAWLKVKVTPGGICEFSYSVDGNIYKRLGESFTARQGRWIGAKLGLFCTRTVKTNDSGFAEFDWLRIDKSSIDKR